MVVMCPLLSGPCYPEHTLHIRGRPRDSGRSSGDGFTAAATAGAEPHPGGVRWEAETRGGEQAEEHLRPGGVWDGIQLTAEALRHLWRAAVWIPTDEFQLKQLSLLQNRSRHCCYDLVFCKAVKLLDWFVDPSGVPVSGELSCALVIRHRICGHLLQIHILFYDLRLYYSLLLWLCPIELFCVAARCGQPVGCRLHGWPSLVSILKFFSKKTNVCMEY